MKRFIFFIFLFNFACHQAEDQTTAGKSAGGSPHDYHDDQIGDEFYQECPDNLDNLSSLKCLLFSSKYDKKIYKSQPFKAVNQERYGNEGHTGIDFAPLEAYAEDKIPVFAATGGEVLAIKNSSILSSLGDQTVLIKFDDAYHYYGHLDEKSDNIGTTVEKGELIGYMGNKGNSTGKHLHYSIHKKFIDNQSQSDRILILKDHLTFYNPEFFLVRDSTQTADP